MLRKEKKQTHTIGPKNIILPNECSMIILKCRYRRIQTDGPSLKKHIERDKNFLKLFTYITPSKVYIVPASSNSDAKFDVTLVVHAIYNP